MKEVLTQLFGDAVTDEALKTFNAEFGKKFVAKADFNAKGEEIKALKAEKQSLEAEISKLNETAKGGEDVKAELEALKAQIESDKKQAEADRIMKEKAESIENRFNECVGDKQFVNDPTSLHTQSKILTKSRCTKTRADIRSIIRIQTTAHLTQDVGRIM